MSAPIAFFLDRAGTLDHVELVHSGMSKLLNLSVDIFAEICISPEAPDRLLYI
jgi:hypothetical protein